MSWQSVLWQLPRAQILRQVRECVARVRVPPTSCAGNRAAIRRATIEPAQVGAECPAANAPVWAVIAVAQQVPTNDVRAAQFSDGGRAAHR